MVVITCNARVLAAIPVVVPGRDDVLGLEEKEHEQEIIARDRDPVGPLGCCCQSDVDGFIFAIDGPFVCKAGVVRVNSLLASTTQFLGRADGGKLRWGD